MHCDACRREAVVYQPYSGKHLCPVHFLKDFEAKAKHAIRSHGWLRPGDHIAVALSGDAASAALLFFLAKLTAARRDIRLSAITIDTGMSGSPAIAQAGAMAAACSVEWHCGSFAERYGMTMDKMVQKNGPDTARRSCRVLLCDLIGEIAEAHGATRCAFATTIDDIAGDFFSSLLSGTVERYPLSLRCNGKNAYSRDPAVHGYPGTGSDPVRASCAAGNPASGTPCSAGPCAGKDSLAADAQAALDMVLGPPPGRKIRACKPCRDTCRHRGCARDAPFVPGLRRTN